MSYEVLLSGTGPDATETLRALAGVDGVRIKLHGHNTARLRKMRDVLSENAQQKVHAELSTAALDPALLLGFDAVVCAKGTPLRALVAADEFARVHGCAFFSVGVFGDAAYCFADRAAEGNRGNDGGPTAVRPAKRKNEKTAVPKKEFP